MTKPAGPTFKYDVEHALTVSCDWAGILSPAQLDSVSHEPDLPVCNLYLIGRRPRLTIDAASWSCDEEKVAFEVVADDGQGVSTSVHLEGPNPFGGLMVKARSNDAQTMIEFHDNEGRLVTGAPSGMWASMYLQLTMPGTTRMEATDVDESILDLDVVYVGQSLDQGGVVERRLLNHATLQRVMAETSQTAPHLEVWIVLMQFATYNKVSNFGRWVGALGTEESRQHLSRVHDTDLTTAELTALAEAALIRYFQPLYNKTFKDHFPAPLHKTYRTVYDLDYNAVGIDFESLTTIGTRLGSKVVSPSFVHAGLFAMHSPTQRRRLLDLFEQETGIDGLYINR